MRLATAVMPRVPATVVVLLLTAALLSVSVTPVHAAAPWRFTERAFSESIASNATEPVVGTCPEGFVFVGGGLSNVDRGTGTFEIVSAYRVDPRTFQIVVHNYGFSSVATITMICALESAVGSLTHEAKTVSRNATTGIASGSMGCPNGSRALFGGADWSAGAGATRRVDFQAPDATGWYASGYSPVEDAVLTIEAYCLPGAALGDFTFLSQDTLYSSLQTAVSAQVSCPAGTRPGSGGAFAYPSGGGPPAGSFMGNDWYSAPSVTEPAWKTTTWVEPNVYLRRTVWCLPASQPTIVFTQTPPTVTNSSDASFTFTATDPAGEAIEGLSCLLDGFSAGCSNSGTTSVNGLSPGVHEFQVRARNESYQTTTQTFSWRIDQTPPELLTPITRPRITGPITIGFSELVSGVPAGLTITRAGTSTPVAGSWHVVSQLVADTLAMFTPTKPLVPGARYDIAASSVIEDEAGNALAPRTVRVRTQLGVQNNSPVLTERWDRDTNASANGGGFIESSASGSRATWKVKTTSGQSVVVYGVRRPNGGYGTVYVDGVKAKRVSFYKAATAWNQAVFQTDPLPAGQHTIAVKVDGTKPSASSGRWVMLDALGIGASHVQETAAVQAFRRVSASAASGGSYDTVLHRTNGDAGARPIYQLVFDGVGITGYVTKTPGSGSADIYIDGVKKSTVSLYSSSVQYDAVGFSVSGLAPGQHTLRVMLAGTSTGSQSSVGLDRLVVH